WSESKGQDDLKWYQPTKQADGTYKLTVRASNHKYTNGKYHVHLYVTDKRNTRTFVAAQTVELKDVPVVQEVIVEHVGTGVHYVKVKHIYNNEKVVYAVWSEKNGQNDLRWYSTKNDDDMAHGVFNVVNHSDTGIYHIHAYQEVNG
ncbi:GBS Bsp-like repeat-containing protein, partial [Streptococcus porci]